MQYSTIVITLAVIVAAACILLLAKTKPNQRTLAGIPLEEEPEIFTHTNQSFEDSITRFSSLSDRAKATFMYRFVQSLSREQSLKLQEYIIKHSN